ncbi:hypothetical protein [Enterococcus avium]|jgi:hypothetical protein|uniref:hypothetical protein n=1 Tax=Enterococcus avium TaxID=33945 RepID=UPI00197A7B9A|nr:hypothetical protein [Enterococcus avium]DAL82266.1 MAG TPA: hypothetical protein [Caudoviricetes sp.]
MKIEIMRHYPSFCDPKQLGRVTLRHYFQMMKAARLRELDNEQNIHLMAWKNREIEATKDKGKYVYTRFDDFFKADKRKDELLGNPTKKVINDPTQKKLLLLANRGGGS